MTVDSREPTGTQGRGRLTSYASAVGILCLVFLGSVEVFGAFSPAGAPSRPMPSKGAPAAPTGPTKASSVVDPRLVWKPPVGRPDRVSFEDPAPQELEQVEVEREATPVDEQQLLEVLRKGHVLAFGTEPSDFRLAVAWAHLALEHGRGRDVECNNYGNVILGDGVSGRFFVRELHERTRKNRLASLGDWKKVTMKFRAYGSPEEGARAYFRLLESSYKSALTLFDAGAAYQAGRRLAELGYATSLPEPYARAMADLHAELASRMLPDPGDGS